jgi:hypothetical protein
MSSRRDRQSFPHHDVLKLPAARGAASKWAVVFGLADFAACAKCSAQVCQRPGSVWLLKKKCGQAPRGPKMKERSSRRPAAKRGNATVGPQQNPASGGVPARASNVRPNALPFIPDAQSFGGDTGLSAAKRAVSHSRHSRAHGA